MQLIYIYGPPASGKLTIASELAKLTGFKLFHNHLTQDLVGTIYPELNDIRYKLVEKLRLDVFEYAARYNTDLIYTQFYTGDEDDVAFIRDTVETVEKYDGSVKFVEVTAPFEVLKQRVGNNSRKAFEKAHDVATLERYLSTSKSTSIEFPRILIDSSTIEPPAAAQSILDKLHLDSH